MEVQRRGNVKWKEYYRKELASPKARDYLLALFEQQGKTHALDDLLRRGAIFSFPHTSVFYAGDAQTQVVSSLYQSKIERVIALGVFHVWGHEATRQIYCQAMDEHEGIDRRQQAFAQLRGGFLPQEESSHTPYGEVSFAPFPAEESDELRQDKQGILKQEFSLDTFLALVKFYSLIYDVAPLLVLPIYVGMTRNPLTGSFELAPQVAKVVQKMVTPETAIVATGDVVHYGNGYSSQEMMNRMPTPAGEVEKLFRKELQGVLDLVVKQHNYSQAFPKLDRFLNSDQRYLLPVIAEMGGKGYDIISFHLSDYTAINGVKPPCFVASSLIAYGVNPVIKGKLVTVDKKSA